MNADPTPTAIRLPRPDDIDTIVDYHHRCWLTAFAPIVEPAVMAFIEGRDRADVAAAWRERLDPDSNARIRVAVDEHDVAIGHVFTHADELVHLFIDPDHHGRGLGRSLLALGERLIRRDGHEVAVLHTLVGNTPAIALYEAQGWVVTDETHIEDLPNGSTYTEHVLRKPMQPGG